MSAFGPEHVVTFELPRKATRAAGKFQDRLLDALRGAPGLCLCCAEPRRLPQSFGFSSGFLPEGGREPGGVLANSANRESESIHDAVSSAARRTTLSIDGSATAPPAQQWCPFVHPESSCHRAPHSPISRNVRSPSTSGVVVGVASGIDTLSARPGSPRLHANHAMDFYRAAGGAVHAAHGARRRRSSPDGVAEIESASSPSPTCNRWTTSYGGSWATPVSANPLDVVPPASQRCSNGRCLRHPVITCCARPGASWASG